MEAGGGYGRNSGEGSSIGGTGGNGGRLASATAGGGAGNPGGRGTSGYTSNSLINGENGTGGLLIIYANNIINNNQVETNGSKGGNDGRNKDNYGGGSSGGGSINIFYKELYKNIGTLMAEGGMSVRSGGAGGTGSISVGNISTGAYESTYTNY